MVKPSRHASAHAACYKNFGPSELGTREPRLRPAPSPEGRGGGEGLQNIDKSEPPPPPPHPLGEGEPRRATIGVRAYQPAPSLFRRDTRLQLGIVHQVRVHR